MREPSTYLGCQAGAYRIARVIGAGGMGVVYEAIHEGLGERAAVKLLLDESRAGSDYAARFSLEARLASAVRHPGLVRVFDYGCLEKDGVPFLLMEYLDGMSLRAHLRAQPDVVGPGFARRIGRQLASAVAALHSGGVVHRDLKPENVIVLSDDAVDGGQRARIVDFGIAEAVGAANRFACERTFAGTPAYIAPEHCTTHHRPATPAADIYSLGVIVFELVVGRPPFLGEPSRILQSHLIDRPRTEWIEQADDLRFLVSEMLAKDPARRPTANEVVRRLGSRAFDATFLSSPPTSWPGTSTATVRLVDSARGARWSLTAIAALTALAGVSMVANRGLRASRPTLKLPSMVRVPGGHLLPAGDVRDPKDWLPGASEPADQGQQKVRPVSVSSFHVDIHEATNAAIAWWLSSTPTVLRPERTGEPPRFVLHGTTHELLVDAAAGGLTIDAHGAIVPRPGREDTAASFLTWDAARLYCAAQGKRLPTEAEWQLAARGEPSRAFPWGNDEPRCDGALMIRAEGLPCASYGPGPYDVAAGVRDWSAAGVHGLAGNVSEWVADVPEAPTSAEEADRRVFRGGSWSSKTWADALARGTAKRSALDASVGVRCVIGASD